MNSQLETMRFILNTGAVMDSNLVQTKSPAVFKVLLEYGLGIHQMITSYEVPLMYALSPSYVFIHLVRQPMDRGLLTTLFNCLYIGALLKKTTHPALLL